MKVKSTGKKHKLFKRSPGYPERFNSRTGKYEPIHKNRVPKHSSKGYPGWICKSCGAEYAQNHPEKRCNKKRGDGLCRGPLIKYLAYEVKQ